MKVLKILLSIFLIPIVLVACAPGSAAAQPGIGQSEPNTSAAQTGAPAGPVDPNAVDITRDPTDLPAPVGQRGPEHVRVDLETSEISGLLADGTSYKYWTFNGKVPGPMIRVRVGDTVELHLKNDAKSLMAHSIDTP
jgi:nitrite reductase (NO-forming)